MLQLYGVAGAGSLLPGTVNPDALTILPSIYYPYNPETVTSNVSGVLMKLSLWILYLGSDR